MAGIQPTATRIRLLLDQDNWETATKDSITGAAVTIPNGADLSLELMFFNSFNGSGAPLGLTDATKLDFTHITSVVVALQDGSGDPHNAATLWSYTVANAGGAINNACTAANWNGGTDQQIKLAITSAVNSILMSGQSQSFWLCIYALTDDATAKAIPLAAWPVSVYDTGIPVANPATQPSSSGYASFLVGSSYYRVSVALVNGTAVLQVDQTPYSSP